MRNNQEKSQTQTSQRSRDDSILLIVIALSITAGIMLPSFGIIFEPFLLIWLGLLLFLNLIKMDLQELASKFKKPFHVIVFTVVKIVAIPLLLYVITNAIYPSLALPVLLLSGISTGLGAPFVINVFEKRNRLPLVVGIVIASSIAVPFVLPPLVYLLVDVSQFHIPLTDMMILLGEALFLPLVAGWLVRRGVPKLAKKIEQNSYIPSIILVSFMNLGIFAKYSDYFFLQGSLVITLIVAAFLLYFVYGLIGYALGCTLVKNNKSFRIAAFVIMSYVNNVLVVVFASQFFGSDVAALAAFYNLSYYSLIIPMKRIFFIIHR
jgi:BASS family bile acid:Na+ symporter